VGAERGAILAEQVEEMGFDGAVVVLGTAAQAGFVDGAGDFGVAEGRAGGGGRDRFACLRTALTCILSPRRGRWRCGSTFS